MTQPNATAGASSPFARLVARQNETSPPSNGRDAEQRITDTARAHDREGTPTAHDLTGEAHVALSAPDTVPMESMVPDDTAGAAARNADQGDPVSVQVLTTTGSARFDAIFAGTVGHLDANNCFRVDEDYSRLSYLFTLAQGSSMPILPRNLPREQEEQQDTSDEVNTQGDVTWRVGEHAVQLAMPASTAKAFKVTCISKASQTWGDLYESVAKELPAGLMGAAMLASERRNVEAAVARYVTESGLTPWAVPVICLANVYEDDPQCRGASEQELLARASMPTNILPDITRVPTPATTTTEQAESNPLPAEVANHHGGLVLTIEGMVQVLANSAAQASEVAMGLVAVANQSARFAQMLRIQGMSIQHVELLEPQSDSDSVSQRDRGDREL